MVLFRDSYLLAKKFYVPLMRIASFQNNFIMPFNRKYSETQWDELTGRCLQRGSLKSKRRQSSSSSSTCNLNKLHWNGAANRCRAAWVAPTLELISQSRVLGAVRMSAACFHLRGLIQSVCVCVKWDVWRGGGARRRPCRPATDRKKKQDHESDPTTGDSDTEIFGLSESVMTTSVCVFPSKLKCCN